MQEFLRHFITNWRLLSETDDQTIIVAVSGGSDSAAMLGALGELSQMGKISNPVIAAYFDHKLRKETAEAEFVRKLASDYSFEFVLGEADSEPPKSGFEAWARSRRYEFLQDVARDAGSKHILVGHTIDDRAETLLLNLVRGAGPRGLSSMRQKVTLESGVELIRPMLNWARKTDTIDYCREKGIEFVEDPTNDSIEYSRNFVRHRVFENLSELNPNAAEAIARSADLLERSNRTMLWLIGRDEQFKEMVSADTLRLSDLNTLPDFARSTIVLAWLERLISGNPQFSMTHLDAIVKLSKSSKSGNTIELPGGWQVVKSSGKLNLKRNGS